MRYIPFTCWALTALVLPWSTWTPLTVGAGLGFLLCWLLHIRGRPMRWSQAYADAAGWLGARLAPRHTAGLSAYQKRPGGLSFGLAFALASVLGAHLAAVLGGAYHAQWTPDLWLQRFGDYTWLRLGVAFWGGVLLAYGWRLSTLRPVALAFLTLAAVCVTRVVYGGTL